MKVAGVVLLLLLLPFAAHGGKGHGVEVRGNLPLLVDIEPGRIVSGSFLVTNTSGRADIFVDAVQLPPGWKKIVPVDGHFSLKAGEQQARLVAFAVPANAPAGEYTLTYAAGSRADDGISDRQSFTVRVLPVHKLEVLLEKKPGIVLAGQAFLVELRLINRGNCTDRIQLAITTNTGFSVDPGRLRVALAGGDARSLYVMVGTDGKQKNKETCRINVIATGEGEKPEQGTAALTTSIEVLPRIPDVDLLQRVPGRWRLLVTEEDGRYGLQAELSGAGILDEAGNRRIDFLFRGPDSEAKNLYGQRDEYRFNLYGEHLDLLLGDQSYVLSPLTERGRYGRGGGARFHFPKLAGGAFSLESRWQEAKESQTGSYLSYQLTDWLGLKGNFLRKEKAADAAHPDLTANLYSLEAAMQWGKKSELGLEYGRSDNERETRTRDHAYRLDLKGEMAGVRYAFEKTYAGPQYFGYYHDADLVSGTITFPLQHKSTGHISYRGYRNNLDLDPESGRATEETSYRAGIRQPFASGTTLSLDVEEFQKTDRLPTPKFDYRETFITAGIGQTFKMATVQAYADRGVLDDALAGDGPADLENYSLHASVSPTPRQRYGIYGRFGHGKYSEQPDRTKSAGISADWTLHRLRLGLNFQIDNFASDTGKKTSNLASTLDYELPNRHALNLRSRWSPVQDESQDDLSFFFAYTVPLGIPVGMKRSVGAITGEIKDVQRGGEPLPNVLVTAAGFAAMTDRNGAFTLPALKPGTYYLTVENGSLGLDRVTAEKMPLAVEVQGGETARVQISVTKAGRISGRLTLAPKNGGDNGLALVGMAGVVAGESPIRFANHLVEIARGDEVLRQMTDAEGRFSFAGLRPGKWAVTVQKENLPPYHYLEKETVEIELLGSEEKELAIRIVPRVRKIQMVHRETETTAPAMTAPAPAAAAAPVLRAAGESYTIHAGTYLFPENRAQAERIIRRLGFAPDSTPVQCTVQMVRLLVGVFPAEETKRRLGELAGAAPDAFALPRGKRVAIYAGSFFDRDETGKLAERLARRGIRVEEEAAQVPMTLQRVTFGPFGDPAAAERAAAAARAAGLEAMAVRTAR